MFRFLLAASLLAPGPIRAQDASIPSAGSGEEIEGDAELVAQVRSQLERDPGLRATLADRLLRSSLAEKLAGQAQSPDSAGAEISAWIEKNPEDAARLAIGFAGDDRNGNQNFEESLNERVRRTVQLNPDRHAGILGTLGAAGSQSKSIIKMDKKMEDEERRELLKRLFEGQGGESGRVLTHKEPPGGGRGQDPATGPEVPGGAGIYDRLSELNPTGYSPQVQSWQSALNAQRVPGAPRLIETGKLDYQTLIHPAHGFRYNMDRIEDAYATQRAWALARQLGREKEFSPEDFKRADVRAALEKDAKGREPGGRFRKRRDRLDRASAAYRAYLLEAEPMRDRSKITKAGLRRLGAHQRDVARWLTAASLEEDLGRIENEEAFWTPELEKLILEAPAPEAERRAFLARAQGVRDRLKRIKAADEAAIAVLEGPAYDALWPAEERRLAAVKPLRRDLSRDAALIARAPYALHASVRPVPRWKAWLHEAVLRLAPGSSLGKSVKETRELALRAAQAFQSVAAGDFAGAEKALSRPG